MRRIKNFIVYFFLIFSSSLSVAFATSWTQPRWSTDSSSGASHRSTKNLDSVGTESSPFSPGSHNLAIDLGQVFLMGDLNKNYNDSIGSQLHYTYGVSDLFGFDSSLGYSSHSDGKFSMATALTGLRMNLSWYDRIVPYLVLGLGFYRPSYQDTTAPVSTGPNASGPPNLSALLFGLHFGPGIDLALSKNLFFGAALTIHTMFGSTQTLSNGTPLILGGTYTSFFLHIGTTF